MIKIEGLALERLLNAAFKEGARLSEIRRLSSTELTARIKPRDLYLLRRLRRRYPCRIRILKKRGIAFCLDRLKTRKVLLWGWLPLLLLLAVLSRFIWFIEVEGCSAVAEEEVYALLTEIGVKTGVPAQQLDHYAISRELAAKDERIAWAGASRKGVVLTVEIVEAEMIPPTLAEDQPGSIYAAKDAVIKRITALKGRSVVQAGETVKQGDLLITGELTSDAGIEHRVAARGEVIARVLYVVTAECTKTARIMARAQALEAYCSASLFGWELFPSVSEENTELDVQETVTLNSFLPITFTYGVKWQLAEQEVVLTRSEREERARRLAEEKVLALIPQDARIVAKHTEIRETDNGGIQAILSVETEEDIAVFGPLDVKNTETQDGA